MFPYDYLSNFQMHQSLTCQQRGGNEITHGVIILNPLLKLIKRHEYGFVALF